MTATLAASAAIIKELYQDGDVPEELYKNNNGFIWLPKVTTFTGAPERIAVQTEHTQGASAGFATAQANILQSKFSSFGVNRVKDYSIARIDGEALEVADGADGSLVDLWDRELKSAMMAAVRSLAIQMYRNGTGSRGQIDASSNTATATITLLNTSEITNFAVGMAVNGSATDGSANYQSSAQEIIAGIDRALGTLTSTSVTWATIITSLSTNDFLYRAGDGINGGTVGTAGVGVIVGLQGWIPGGAAPGTLFGLSRNTDPVRLAGQLYSALGTPIEEAVIEAIARVGVEGGTPDTLLCHPRDKANLMKSLETKTRYPKSSRIGTASVGFDAVTFESDTGPIDIISDMNCPRYKGFLLQKDTWFLGSVGKAPRILNFDKQDMLRVYNADSYEVRIGSYVQMVCRAPAWNLQISNFGT